MALRRQMDDAGDMLLLHEGIDRIEITDVRTYEAVIRLVLDVLEVGKVAGIRQFVHIDNAVLGVLVHEQPYYMASDKSGSAGDDYALHYNE